MKALTLAAALMLVPAALPAAPAPAPGNQTAKPAAAVPGFKFVRQVGDIAEYQLESNGLTVLLLEDHSAPVATFQITYRVGSRNEVTGTTGATHLLEHLMFKGSQNFSRPKGNNVDQFLESIGANYNATTWLDRTNYYAEMASEHLEGYIRIEADRMRNLLLREDDRRPEMTVVRNEFEIGENDPQQLLDKEIFAAAYQAHPYHHSTIGWRSDIERVPIEKLKEFYDTFYWPDNATVSVIGDINPAATLELVKKYYGQIPKAPKPIPPMYTEEPEQYGPRRVTVRRTGEVGVVSIGFKSPSARHQDTPALKVLSAILDEGKTSRLYRTLIDQSLATSVNVDVGYFHDPSLLQIYANVAPNTTHEKVEQAVLEALETVKRDGVKDEEVTRAVSQLLAQRAYGRDGSFAIADDLNEDIAVGDWTLFYRFGDAIKQVKPADVKRVANLYLNVDRSTTGWFIPLSAESQAPAATKK